MIRQSFVLIALWAAALGVSPESALGQALQGPEPDREITQLRGDLYEAREGQQHTVFLVTPDGIIVADPLNVAFAQWLKDQLGSRFPGRTVRYVVFSHHHFDRAEGGTAFAGATIVAQDRYNGELSRARGSVPTFLGVQDRNENGRFDRAELEGPDAALLMSRDRNSDGAVTLNELYGLVPSVRSTYSAGRTITLGGKQVELVHSGTWHSPDMTVLFFPAERIVLAVDPPPVTVVPFSFGVTRPNQVYEWLHAVTSLDFDTLISGDGTTICGADPTGPRGEPGRLAALSALSGADRVHCSGTGRGPMEFGSRQPWGLRQVVTWPRCLARSIGPNVGVLGRPASMPTTRRGQRLAPSSRPAMSAPSPRRRP